MTTVLGSAPDVHGQTINIDGGRLMM